jgi:hypothetical protein
MRAYPPYVGGYATIYADTVPVDVYAYPHVWYDGGYAYLVNDEWYYPTAHGWVVLREEPPTLYQYRRQFVQQAPPAYPYYGPGYAPRTAPPPQYGYPPPAQRVR